jgi:hypothetical protein
MRIYENGGFLVHVYANKVYFVSDWSAGFCDRPGWICVDVQRRADRMKWWNCRAEKRWWHGTKTPEKALRAAIKLCDSLAAKERNAEHVADRTQEYVSNLVESRVLSMQAMEELNRFLKTTEPA